MKATHSKETPVGGCLERLVGRTVCRLLGHRFRIWCRIPGSVLNWGYYRELNRCKRCGSPNK